MQSLGMTMLQLSVNFPSAVLPDTVLNRNKVFVIGSYSISVTTFGNVPQGTVPSGGSSPVNMNNPFAKAAIAGSSYSQVYFDSADLYRQADVAGQLVSLIEAGYITVVKQDSPGQPLSRSDIMPYIGGITPDPDALLFAEMPNLRGVDNFVYTAAIPVSGGVAPVVITLEDGTLPTGISIVAADLDGTPTTVETQTGLRLLATDAEGRTALSTVFTFQIFAELLFATVGDQSIPEDVLFTLPLGVTGGVPTVVVTLEAGTLPTGLSIVGLTITGTPTTVQTQTGIQLRATDAEGNFVLSDVFEIEVTA
jgi:hypothetical protein